MSCLRLHSRSGVPTAPRKYLVVTMFAALMLQKSGYSTPRCSKLIDPSRQFVITTSRRSQVTSSYGCTPDVVYTRAMARPLAAFCVVFAVVLSTASVMSCPFWCGCVLVLRCVCVVCDPQVADRLLEV